MNPAAATRPAQAGPAEPVREKTRTPRATVCIHDPRLETRAADQMRAKFRERSGWSEARATDQGYRRSQAARLGAAGAFPGPYLAGFSPLTRPTCRASPYLSSFTLRRGRRANHQMLAMVASTPKAAAGLTILRDRSDMTLTLPGPPHSHPFLPIFFRFSYPLLGISLGAARNMGTCTGAPSKPATPPYGPVGRPGTTTRRGTGPDPGRRRGRGLPRTFACAPT